MIYIALAILVGSAVQGVTGLGMSLVALPVVAAFRPELLPQVLLLLSLPTAAAMVQRERAAADFRAAGWMILGRLIGTPLAVPLVAALTVTGMQVWAGITVLAVCSLLLARGRGDEASTLFTDTVRTKLGAGFVSGVMGTSTGVGGPFLALSYSSRAAADVRATLATVFVVGNAISLGVLAASGLLSLSQIRAAAPLVAPMLIGYLASRVVTPRLAQRSFESAVLLLAGAGGVLLIIRAMT